MTLGLVAGSIVARPLTGAGLARSQDFLSLLMWAVYMVMVFTRWNAGWRERRAAYLLPAPVIAAVIAWSANYYSAIHGFVHHEVSTHGVNHKTAPVEVRERFAIPSRGCPRA
jgi:hypothetical protein